MRGRPSKVDDDSLAWCTNHPNEDGTIGAALPKEEFYSNIARSTGVDSRCKDCSRKYQKERYWNENKRGSREEGQQTPLD